MIYLDTSALAKLVVVETESAALSGWLQQRSSLTWVTSAVGHIELLRLAARYDATASAVQLLSGLDTVPLDGLVAAMAAEVYPQTLRTVDAIHLASALLLRDQLTAFCSYDRRLADAAKDMQLPVERPA